MYANLNEYEVRDTINYNVKARYEAFCTELEKIINKFTPLQQKTFHINQEQLKKYSTNDRQLAEYIKLCLSNAQYMSIKEVEYLRAYLKAKSDDFKSIIGGYAIDAMINITKIIDDLNKYLSIIRNQEEKLIQHANASEINNIEQIKELRRIVGKADRIMDSYMALHKKLISITGILHAIIIL